MFVVVSFVRVSASFLFDVVVVFFFVVLFFVVIKRRKDVVASDETRRKRRKRERKRGTRAGWHRDESGIDGSRALGE